MIRGKSIIEIDGLTREDIDSILNSATSFIEVLERKVKKVPTLRGNTIANLFFEPSTRTKNSFEIAAKRLSADLINFSASTSSLKKGESIIDTINTILGMKVNLFIIRHSDSGICRLISRLAGVPVINAGDGKHEHPTQALLDIYTIRESFGKLEGLKVAIVGDFLNSRVARSNIKMFKKMGLETTIVSPTMLLPEDEASLGLEIEHSIDEVIREADIIYMLRMQFERQARKFYPSIKEYNKFLSLDTDRFFSLKENSIVMHPGPVNRGIEISEELMDLADSNKEIARKFKIGKQVTNGVAIRMALLYLILG